MQISFYRKTFATLFIGALFLVGGVAHVYAEESADANQTPAAAQSTPVTDGTVVTTEPPDTPGRIAEEQAEGAGVLLNDLTCNPFKLNMTGCAPIFAYNILYRPAAVLLSMAATLFDYSLALSIDRDFIDQAFVKNAWTIMRDFANMAFIFILLYAGITTILGMGEWKRTVIQVVIVALFINFSLFFTKAIIDVGNILAVGIYSAIGPDPADTGAGVEKREVSGNLVAALEPQRFTDTAASGTAFDALIVFLIAAVVNIVVAWAFFKVALMFIGRLIGFWVLMIVSPIAFISTATPKGDMFHDWLHKLIDITFVAPVFLFFIYIILLVLQSDFITSLNGTLGTVPGYLSAKLLLPAMVAIVIVYMISKAVSFAEHMAGTFGELGSAVGGKIVGVAGGLALGGAATLGRQTVGRFADSQMDRFRNMANDTRAGALGSTSRFVGRNLTLASERARNASFDARSISYVQNAAERSGVSVGEGRGEGFVAVRDRQESERRERTLERANILAEISPEAEAEIRESAERAANAQLQVAQVALATSQETARATNQEIVAATAAQKQASQELADAAKRLKDAEDLRQQAATQAELDAADFAVQRAQGAKVAAEAANNQAVAALQNKKSALDDILEEQKRLQEAATKAQETREKAADKAVENTKKDRREAYARTLGARMSGVSVGATREEIEDFVQYVRNPNHEEEAAAEALKQLRRELAEQNRIAMDAARQAVRNQRQAQGNANQGGQGAQNP